MEMNLKQLKYVVTLAKAGNFSNAADELGISQPSLSQYIKKIETQVGMELFDRANGYVKLTDAGKVYIKYGQKIINLEHHMETAFSDISSNKTGSIVIGVAPYRSIAMMPEIAKMFKEKYPGIYLSIEEDIASALIDRSEKGEFDLCLTMLPIDERIFHYELIMEEELIIAVPSSYKKLDSYSDNKHKYEVIDINEVNGHNFVMLTESQVMQKTLQNLCIDNDLKLKQSVVVKSLEAQINMVRAGLGMALVPTGIEKFCKEGEVKFYSIKQKLPKRKIVAMWRKDHVLPQTVKDLIDIMKNIDW